MLTGNSVRVISPLCALAVLTSEKLFPSLWAVLFLFSPPHPLPMFTVSCQKSLLWWGFPRPWFILPTTTKTSLCDRDDVMAKELLHPWETPYQEVHTIFFPPLDYYSRTPEPWFQELCCAVLHQGSVHSFFNGGLSETAEGKYSIERICILEHTVYGYLGTIPCSKLKAKPTQNKYILT